MRYIAPPHVHNTSTTTDPRIGVVLANLGTPDAPTYGALRRYLKEFLSDPRVIEAPRWFWLPLLNGIILQTRPGKSAQAYAKIWDKKADASPLRVYTEAQATGLQEQLNWAFPDQYIVRWGMRYGQPSIAAAVTALKESGCNKILLLPLYPQYAGATTASACEAFFAALTQWRWMPTPRVASPFYDHPAYIDALKNSVTEHLGTLGWTPEKLLVSYHGIPQSYFKQGDPYPCHCWKTSRLLAKALQAPPGYLETSFQSRFGPTQWVQPYTDETLVRLAKEGVRKLAVLSPAFYSDCVETLEELAIAGRETFLAAGGTDFTLIPCLNDTPESIDLLTRLVAENTADWTTAWDTLETTRED